MYESRSTSIGGVELRSEKHIGGLAAVYYDGTPKTEYKLGPKLIERIHPGAFKEILESRSEVFGLYHHDESQLLGRLSSNTLQLTDEARGLAYSINYDATDPIHQSVAAKIRRGDVTGSSFTFAPKKQKYERRSDGFTIRNIYEFATLRDVGPTHLPAYAGATAEFRSELDPSEVARLHAIAQTELGLDPPTPLDFYRWMEK